MECKCLPQPSCLGTLLRTLFLLLSSSLLRSMLLSSSLLLSSMLLSSMLLSSTQQLYRSNKSQRMLCEVALAIVCPLQRSICTSDSNGPSAPVTTPLLDSQFLHIFFSSKLVPKPCFQRLSARIRSFVYICFNHATLFVGRRMEELAIVFVWCMIVVVAFCNSLQLFE